MANERVITVTVTGKDKTGPAFKSAETGFDKMAGASDRIATKASLLTGAFGALDSGFQLFGMEGSAAAKVAQQSMLAMDALSGVADLATLATTGLAAAKASEGLATMGATIAAKAAAVGTALMTGAQWALNAALSANPIGLIILAIAALVGGFILAYNKVGWFRAAVDVAFAAIKLAIGKVIDGTKMVIGWVKSNWPAIQFMLTHPIDAFRLALPIIWGKVTGFFKSAPGKMKGIFTGMFDGIRDAFRSALNFIISKWNSLSFGIPGFDYPGGHWGGVTIHTPHIGTFAAGSFSSGSMSGYRTGGPAQPRSTTVNVQSVLLLDGRQIATVAQKVVDQAERRRLVGAR